MIQGKSDSCQSDRVQRYKTPQTNANTPVEALTPDYIQILGSEPISAAATSNLNEPVSLADQPRPAIPMECDGNVIPNIPQFGVAMIINSGAQDTDTHNAHVPDTTNDNDHPYKLLLTQDQAITDAVKDVVVHTTPSRTNHINSNNDRFKVVKIATLEPFRRGRWKCMDYVDENPPISTAPVVMCKTSNNNLTQQQQYMQTQSLPQQHFQQMQQQFYQNLPTTAAQLQFFYPPQSTAQQQATTATFLNTGGGGAQLPPGAAAGATYYQQVIPNSSGGMTLVNYPGVQYVPANLVQTQTGSAFVPTSQNINTTTQLPSNLQQSQTYGGPSNSVSTGHQGQPQQPTQKQAPIVNGHAFPPITHAGEPQQATTVAQQTVVSTTSTLPTHAQAAKNVILATQQQLPLQPGGQYSINQQQAASTAANFQTKTSAQATSIAAAILTPSSMQAPLSNQATNVITTVTSSNNNNLISGSIDVASAVAAAANMYSNPQFVASVNKIVESAVSMIDAATANADGANPMQPGQHQHNVETQSDTGNGEQAGTSSASATGEDTAAKPNPVVNAIDNKIEQAMDLVKSHLMFTVREEVEVLKEKISELMERIQQLENENNMLRLQLPLQKQHVLIQQQQSQQTASNLNVPTETSPTSGQQQLQQQQQQQHQQ